jgi:MGT family glycosyltransferase
VTTDNKERAVTKFAFFSFPAQGHMNPILPVVRELVDRGEEVVFSVTPEHEAKVRATGASFRPYAVDATNLATVANVFPQLVEIALAERPDIIVYDAYFPLATVLPRAVRARAAAYRTTYAGNEHFNHARDAPKLDVSRPPPEHRLFLKMAKELRQVSAGLGLAPIDIAGMIGLSEELNLIHMPREFHPAGETFDERYLFVGPSIGHTPEADFPLDRIAEGGALYISMGTIFNELPEFYRTCFEAFGGERFPVVLSCSERARSDLSRASPSNFIVAAWAPQLEVLPRTSAFVTHGGMGSVMESLYYGVPMIVLPQMFEQAVTARRVAELGLGLALDAGAITAAALRDAVARVRDEPSFRESSRWMQRATRAAGGHERAASALAAFARRSRI